MPLYYYAMGDTACMTKQSASSTRDRMLFASKPQTKENIVSCQVTLAIIAVMSIKSQQFQSCRYSYLYIYWKHRRIHITSHTVMFSTVASFASKLQFFYFTVWSVDTYIFMYDGHGRKSMETNVEATFASNITVTS